MKTRKEERKYINYNLELIKNPVNEIQQPQLRKSSHFNIYIYK